MIINTKRVTTTYHTGLITFADIIKAFDLPGNAKVVFDVPGGGALSLEEHPLRVAWKG